MAAPSPPRPERSLGGGGLTPWLRNKGRSVPAERGHVRKAEVKLFRQRQPR